MAKHCGLEAYEFVYFLGNAHIYEQHRESLETQISRTPNPFPKIYIKNRKEKIEDYTLEDLVFDEYYVYHPSIKMDMVA